MKIKSAIPALFSLGLHAVIIYNVGMKLIIGLGNPGKEYEKTRHNVGFMCIDGLAEKLGLPEFKLQKKFEALVSEGAFNEEKLILAKPQTFMNLSGLAVAKLVNFYNCEPKDIFVIYDDVDLPLGKIRIRPDGSAGSHNGMKSIVEHLGFSNFPRLRIGIESRGLSAPHQQEISSFVLTPFLKEEQPNLKKALEDAVSAVLLSLTEGIPKSMEKYN